MNKYRGTKNNKSSKASNLSLVLPVYKLDSNLVLLPGVIYNVTFSRFKAAALLARYREKVEHVSLIKVLLNEYEFDKREDEEQESEVNPSVISEEAVEGIKEFYRYENDAGPDAEPQSEFDWMLMGINPNSNKISDPTHSNLDDVCSKVYTIVRVVGIVDDTTNIKLTLQALTRGVKRPSAKPLKPIEKRFEIDLSDSVVGITEKVTSLNDHRFKLFKAIDNFVVDYRHVLNDSGRLKQVSPSNKKQENLLTLNPLANALYLQLSGSKDFTKAYMSLQKLYSSVMSSKKVDEKTFLRLIDLTCAIVPFPNHEKLKLLSKVDISERINEIHDMISKMISIFDNLKTNNSFISHWFYNEATNIQKANIVANQLKSIKLVLEGMSANKNSNQKLGVQNSGKLVRRKPPSKNIKAGDDLHDEDDWDEDDDDDDDLKNVTNFVKNKLPRLSSISEESKRLIVKDYKRLKSSPPGNSDFHVIRSYLETVIDLPWDRFVTKFKDNKDIDIVAARAQLDEDHYGLDHVKRRLVQYLVVLKLLGINAESEYEKLKVQDNNESQARNKEIVPSHGESSIIIPNDDETSSAHEAAREKIKLSKSTIATQENSKSVIVSKNNKSPIIMLAGPPGTGKTSLAKSIAKSLGRNFQRISLGGVKDESEIRGHRRTYVGAMPGIIIQSLRKARSMNPVILLDEIDKVVGGSSNMNKVNGDPSAALLEVLDPEQNSTFVDHYLGFPVDLSQVIFICTANEPSNLARPLLDRLEMIEVSAYDYNQKIIIGERYLLPRQIRRNGFPSSDLLKINESIMKKIVIDYTREAGVRNLERKLGTICRFKAVEYAESLDGKTSYTPIVRETDLPRYLGVPFPHLSSEIVESPIESSRYGVVNGLSYNSDGSGSVLIFESIGFTHESAKASLSMTGRLGEVLMESANIGLTFIKSIIFRNLLNTGLSQDALNDRLNNLEIHMHVPQGSISKDGPSAGITMALSFLSLLLEKPVPYDLAMTGEITLRGLVLPIGGLKEKLLGAHLTGIKRVIVPRENRTDIIDEYVTSINDDSTLHTLLKDNANKYDFKDTTPETYFYNKYGLKIYYASEFWDVIKYVWGDELLVKVDQLRMVEYHL